MKKIEIVSNVSRKFHKLGLKVKKYSPEILVVTGIVGGITSCVMACKATTKLDEILDNAKEDIEAIHEAAEHPEKLPEPYTVEDSKKDLTIVYVQTGVKLAKLYGPAVILGTASVASILAGHNIIRKRNAAITAAYAALDKGFKDYRGRVVERFGKELDRELRYNIKSKEVDDIVVSEDGKEQVVKSTVNVIDDSTISPHARFFDVGNDNWTKDPEFNLMYLRRQQDYATEVLKRRGYLFLNDVYDMLGMARSRVGQEVGWIYDEECPNGDNYVDFGIYNVNREANRRFVNGYERSILLDFNIDGVILDKI